MGETGAAAHAEIVGIARRVCEAVVTGDYREAMAAFVDYWNGSGGWDALRPSVQAGLIRWAPKAPLDFRALIDEASAPEAYRALDFPVLILRGEHAPAPTRLIADYLAQLLPASRLTAIDRAGHMGPITHASVVSGEIARHIAATAMGARESPRQRPHSLAGILAGVRRGRRGPRPDARFGRFACNASRSSPP
jgi:pimeloyl-ACP methyl ester carboxylesterase